MARLVSLLLLFPDSSLLLALQEPVLRPTVPLLKDRLAPLPVYSRVKVSFLRLARLALDLLPEPA
jgi:hypothetical protein